MWFESLHGFGDIIDGKSMNNNNFCINCIAKLFWYAHIEQNFIQNAIQKNLYTI